MTTTATGTNPSGGQTTGTPRGMRLHIGIFGRCNAGKSSLVNALCGQAVSLVSSIAGTTTDPVEKAAELAGIGPVVYVDTAGLDDAGALGGLRVARTRTVLEHIDAGVLVVEADSVGAPEEELLAELERRRVPALVALNKTDLVPPRPELVSRLAGRAAAVIPTVATRGEGVDAFRDALAASLSNAASAAAPLLGDLIPPGGLCVLVVPVDSEAPQGRLILPQVQAIRDLLDHHALAFITTDRELRAALGSLKVPPSLVVTDSQAFGQVATDTPRGVPITSFSILLARQKGDLEELVRGSRAIGRLRPGDQVLVAEACTHHPTNEDIGRVKLPRWLNRIVGGELVFETVAGRDFPRDLAKYKLVIHCGACMHNRRSVLSRIGRCREAGVPITNYGLAIATSLGIIERALEPFPGALAVYRDAR